METFTLKRILFLLISVLLLIFIISLFKDNLKNEMQKNFLGVKEFLWKMGLNSEKSCAFSEARENIDLVEFESLRKENEFLREIIGISINKDFEFEIANVTGKNSFEDVVTINKGIKNGVKEGMAVLTSEKALVGKILKAYNDYSEVMLISNKDSLIDVEIVSRNTYAIARGSNNEKIMLDHLEKDLEVKEGDICITSSLGGQYKEGLLIGKIVKIHDLASEVFKGGEAKLFFSLGDLDKVLIIKDDK